MEAAEYDLIVAGAGPAGSACAIRAAREGARVLLLDKDRFPRHKVCGEFVSSESLRLLDSLLGEDLFHTLPEIGSARIFLDGKSVTLAVQPAARSIPRFDLDAALLAAARRAGVTVCEGTAVREVRHDDLFRVATAEKTFTAKAVVNTSGRWSQLTQRDGLGQEKWIGLKAHFSEASAPQSVDLYFFEGGYCGVTPIGRNTVNACALVRADAATSLEEVLALYPELWRRSRDWERQFATIKTSGLHFREPQTEDRGMLLAGDAAGFIDPFAGDGISLALHSGVMAAESLRSYIKGEMFREAAAAQYRKAYFRRLAPALRDAARIRSLFAAPAWLRGGLLRLAGTRGVGGFLVQRTRVRL